MGILDKISGLNRLPVDQTRNGLDWMAHGDKWWRCADVMGEFQKIPDNFAGEFAAKVTGLNG